jgi:AraC-like DNA-binding protein
MLDVTLYLTLRERLIIQKNTPSSVFSGDYIIVDNPNIVPTATPEIPMGEMSDALAPFRKQEELRALEQVRVGEMYLPNVTLRNMSGRIGQNAVFVNKQNQGSDLLASCLFIDGSVTSTLRGETKGIEVGRGLQSLKYDPNNEYLHWCRANTPFNIIHLSILPSFLFGMLPQDEPWTHWLHDQIAKRQRVLSETPPQITMAQHRVLQNILNCPMQGKMGLLMLETSIIQLILLQLYAQFTQFDNTSAVRRPVKDTLSHDLKEHLDKTFLDEHSIASLATQFGTNTSKLMSMFRRTFGITIFEYIHELKMEHAKMLIADKGYYVCEAAREIGYKNPHHFAAAFKRKHGISPSALKTQG